MNKEIKYTGLAAVPSDYDCPDGDLSLSLNLLNEQGASLRALPTPAIVRSFHDGETPAFLHKPVGAVNLISTQRDPLLEASVIRSYDHTDPSAEPAVVDSLSARILSFTAVGNTLVAVTSEGLRYYLYKDGAYVALGERPPFVSISFGMFKAGSLTDSTTTEISDCPVWTWNYFSPASDSGRRLIGFRKESDDEAALRTLSSAVMGLLLSNVAEKVTANGLFYQPCFVRYALRLFDGSYAWHSAPVLLLPDICPPRVLISKSSFSDGKLSITSTLNVPYFGLSRRILSDGLARLDLWSDVVSSLDVFVSAPLYTYSQSVDIVGRTSLASIYARSSYVRASSSAASSSSAGNIRRPVGGVDPTPEYVFVGHYADSLSADAKDIIVKPADYSDAVAWDIRPANKFEDSISGCGLFYLLDSIPLRDIAADGSPVAVQPDVKDLSQLVTRPVLPDDWQSHFRMMPSFATVYNSRLHLCGMRLRLPDPLPVAASLPASGSASQQEAVAVRVWSRRNGVRCCVLSASHGPADLFPLSSLVPRWLWYPDPSAFMMEISSAGKVIRVPLSPHPALNGAYWFAGLDAYPAVQNVDADSASLPDSAPAPSKVYVSEATNPFTFPASGIVTVGSGNVLALSSAAKALSQGQFGQFPLYAFSDEGVWAMEINAEGKYSARQPITRDVALSPDAICQIDSAVLFCSSRGLMLLSGSQSQCVSESIATEYPFALSALPGLDALLAISLSSSDDLYIVPFQEFLAGARMIYDYTHQRIIVFNKEYSYAYVYSLKSKLWGMASSGIDHTVNSYPEALALDKDGRIVDFSHDTGDPQTGLLISRPLKLGAPDLLKSVRQLHQRGHFQKGHVKSLLYGSRDLVSWHLVSSSVSHRILNRSGSPYRYFRIALICDLSPSESISGASITFLPRLPGRIG